MKIVIITGASRGIGKATALECANRNIGVVATYNTHRAGADEVVSTIVEAGGKAVALALDVGVAGSFGTFTTSVKGALKGHWGRENFDYLVNNAGFGIFNPIETVTEDQFDRLFNVHLKGPFFLTQQLMPLLKDGGAIVNLSSATTRVATPGVAPYAAFKGGIEVLTRYMAKEFGERRIRVNSVSPGAILTDLADGALAKSPDFQAALAAQTAIGRVGTPEDIARVIAMLLSDDSIYVNAQNLEAAGGFMI